MDAIDERGHVLPKSSLIVEHVPASELVQGEIAVEDLAQGRSDHHAGGAVNVPLDILREPDGRHGSSTT